MSALTSQSIVATGTTPSPTGVGATDTIKRDQFGSIGCLMRVINANAAPDNVAVADPPFYKTANSNPGTVTPVAVPATTGVRFIFIPLTAIDPATDLATITHSVQTTVTCELYRV